MESQSRAKTLVKNTIWIYIGKLITQLFGIVSSILVIRKLDIEIYGSYNLLIGSMMIFSLFAISPIVDVFNRYIPELFQNKEFSKIKKLTRTGIIISTLGTILLLILTYFYQNNLSQFFNLKYFHVYILSFIIFVLMNLLRSLIIAILCSLLLHKEASLLNMSSSFLRSVLYVALLPYLNVTYLLYIEAFVNFIYFIPGLKIINNVLEKNRNNETTHSLQLGNGRIIRYGFFTFFNQIGSGIVGRTSDYYIISAMSNLYNIGLYGFALKIYDIFQKILPVNDFVSVLRPLFFQHFIENNSKETFIHLYNFMIKVMIPVFTVPFLYFIIFGGPVINFIFDPKYINGYVLTCFVLTSNVVAAVFFPLQMVVQLKEQIQVALYSKIIIVFSIIGGIASMRYFGILGVAFTSLIGEFLNNLFIYLLIRKKAGLAYHWSTFQNYIIIFSILSLIFIPFKSYFNSFILFFTGSIVFFCFFIILIIIFHPFDTRELNYFSKMMESIKYTRKIHTMILKIANFLPKFSKNNT